MSLAHYIPLASAITNAFLAVFVLLQNPRAATNRLCALFGAGVTVWNFGSYRVFLSGDAAEAAGWVRFLHFGLIFGPPVLFHLALLVSGVKVSRWIALVYLYAGGLALTNCTPGFIAGARHLGRAGYYGEAGPFYYFFLPLFTFLFLSIYIMWRKRPGMAVLYRARVDSLLWAFGLLVLVGSNDVLPILGVEKYPFTGVTVYPIGSLAALGFGFMMAYGVLQHQLLDVRVAMSRVAAHAVRLMFLTGAGTLALFWLGLLFPARMDGWTFGVSLGVLLASGLVASLLFPRLFGSGSDFVEQRILGDRFEYHDRIRRFIVTIHWYTDLAQLLEDCGAVLLQALGARGYRVILLDETKREYRQVAGFPKPGGEEGPLPEDSGLVGYFRETGASGLGAGLLSEAGEAGAVAMEALEKMGAELCFPFVYGEEVFGLLAVGKKRSGEPFTATDVRLLRELVTALGLAINQIQLKNQVLRAQEMELLGRMSRGMAHDLNNLLTPIWTLMQLLSEGASKEDVEGELLPVAMRNVRAIRAYIQDALFFSEQLHPDWRRVAVRAVLEQSADMAAARLKRKRLEVEVEADPAFEAEIDEVLIQRMLWNLIANAADASPEGGRIRVSAMPLLRGDPLREWIRFSVADQGTGIAKEHAGKVLRPYFSTKIRGDEGRGFGLGLAICRRIVAVHGGTIELASPDGGGTVAAVEIPARRPAHEAGAPESVGEAVTR